MIGKKFEVVRHVWLERDLEAGLVNLLDTGWEPFAIIPLSGGGLWHVWAKRRRKGA